MRLASWGIGLATLGLLGFAAPQAVALPLVNDHDPILIRSDLDFTPLQGVVGGTGTAMDPYLISDWVLHAGPQAAGRAAAFIDIADTTAHFVIRNVTIQEGAVPKAPPEGIMLSHVRDGRIEASQISGFQGHGIFILGSSGVSIARNHLKLTGNDAGMAIFVDASNQLVLDANDFTGTGAAAIVFSNVDGFALTHNRVHDLTTQSGDFTAQAGGAVLVSVVRGSGGIIADNTVQQSGLLRSSPAAIAIAQVDGISVTGNTILDNTVTHAVISLSTVSDADVSGNVVKGNHASQDGVAAIDISDASHITVRKNTLEGNRLTGIRFTGVTDVSTSANQIFDASGAGFTVHSSTLRMDGDAVRGTRMDPQSGDGLHLIFSTVVSNNLTVAGSATDGIEAYGGNLTLHDVRVLHSGGDGIFASGPMRVSVLGCSSDDNGGFGMHLDVLGPAGSTQVVGCSFAGNSKGATQIQESSKDGHAPLPPTTHLLAAPAAALGLVLVVGAAWVTRRP